jgi:hypothetical protein
VAFRFRSRKTVRNSGSFLYLLFFYNLERCFTRVVVKIFLVAASTRVRAALGIFLWALRTSWFTIDFDGPVQTRAAPTLDNPGKTRVWFKLLHRSGRGFTTRGPENRWMLVTIIDNNDAFETRGCRK